MRIVPIRITRADFDELLNLQRKHRWDWPAWFSANRHGNIWACTTRGYTPFDKRKELRGRSCVLDKVATKYLMARSELGRFFINEEGAFRYNDESGEKEPFVVFDWIK
jgi:hypothetical protein